MAWLTILWTHVKRYYKVIFLLVAFFGGVYVSHVYHDRSFEKFKNEQLQAVIDSHKAEVKKYEETIAILDSDLSDSRALASERLRQLEQWKLRYGAKSEACNASAILGLAIEGENLLGEADAMLRALMR